MGNNGHDSSQATKESVTGSRSPRWAVWARMMIPCFGGVPYLARLRLVQTPWFGIYLHDIHEADQDRDSHNHPWSFISIVLRGSYTERVYPAPMSSPEQYIVKRHRRFSAHRMNTVTAHRIVEAEPGLKTLILTGPRHSNWGFFVDGRFVPWQKYVNRGKVTGTGSSVMS